MNKTEELRKKIIKIIDGSFNKPDWEGYRRMASLEVERKANQILKICNESGLAWHWEEIDYDRDDRSFINHEVEEIDV